MFKVLMVLVSSIICVILINKTYSKDKLKCRLFYSILVIWTLLILFSIPSYKNTFPLSSKTTFLLCLGNISLSFGYCMYSYKKVNINLLKNKFQDLKKGIKKRINLNKFFFYSQILLLISFSFYLIRYQTLLDNLGPEMSRLIKFELGLLFKTKIESYVFQFIFTPILYVSIFYYGVSILEGELYKKGIVLLILNIILYSLIGQGRMIFFELLLIMYIFAVKVLFENIKLFKKFYKYIVIICFILIILLISMTFLRMDFSLDKIDRLPEYIHRIVMQIYIYFTGSFKALDYFVCRAVDFGSFIPGQFTFSIILEPIINFLNSIFSNFHIDNALVFLQEYVPISEYTSYNALFTYYINFYMDFSYFGFILFPIFIGYFYAFLIDKINYNNIMFKIFVYYNFMNLLMGIFRWQYQNYTVICSLIIILVLYLVGEEKEYDSINI